MSTDFFTPSLVLPKPLRKRSERNGKRRPRSGGVFDGGAFLGEIRSRAAFPGDFWTPAGLSGDFWTFAALSGDFWTIRKFSGEIWTRRRARVSRSRPGMRQASESRPRTQTNAHANNPHDRTVRIIVGTNGHHVGIIELIGTTRHARFWKRRRFDEGKGGAWCSKRWSSTWTTRCSAST